MKKIIFVTIVLLFTIAQANEIENVNGSTSKKVSYRIAYFLPGCITLDSYECDHWSLNKVLNVDHLPPDYLTQSQEERDWWRDKTEIRVEFSTEQISENGRYRTGFEFIRVDTNAKQLKVQQRIRYSANVGSLTGTIYEGVEWSYIGESSVYKKGEIVGYAKYENGNPKYNYQVTYNNGHIYLVRIDYIYQ